MNAVVYITLGAFGISAVALWYYCFLDLARSEDFAGGSKTMWFLVILLAPVGGSIAYLSAKRNIQRYSKPDAGRIARLTRSHDETNA
jgi:hypothetical protein